VKLKKGAPATGAPFALPPALLWRGKPLALGTKKARGEGCGEVAHIIVVGNEKGGSGKSTTSMHVATALVRLGHRVGALDLDLRQRSFGRYVENRRAFMARKHLALPSPDYRAPDGAGETGLPAAALEARFADLLEQMMMGSDFIVIDCPGSHTRMSQWAHALADTLITPLNDSFIDFDLLARTDPDSGKILGPSIYAEMVWAARQTRASAGLKPIDWIVLRNRLGAQAMHNKRKVGSALEDLSAASAFAWRPAFPNG
jgi:chromosome partitioning protein